ncbi:unnamed protein product [Didymodactylos carnosus]|uniref:Uncharacterized protein n=1 Tax=Didymodactylos carnosus TaxID=1234261 RepID=A0A815CZT0_9BILA|nr:unnamed protein product [Didymodactylos carnosus]CAF4088509.1 unnamed protein product [Didymodactylos carnosus]
MEILICDPNHEILLENVTFGLNVPVHVVDSELLQQRINQNRRQFLILPCKLISEFRSFPTTYFYCQTKEKFQQILKQYPGLKLFKIDQYCYYLAYDLAMIFVKKGHILRQDKRQPLANLYYQQAKDIYSKINRQLISQRQIAATEKTCKDQQTSPIPTADNDKCYSYLLEKQEIVE